MMRRQTPSPVHRRMNALLLLDDGWAVERVAVALFIDAETVREHRRLYQTSGIAGVERLTYEGSEPALSQEQLTALERVGQLKPYMTAKAVREFARRMIRGRLYAERHDQAAEVRLGFVYKMPKMRPAKADAAVQQRFVEQDLGASDGQSGQRKTRYISSMPPASLLHGASEPWLDPQG